MQILQARRRELPACIGYPAGEPHPQRSGRFKSDIPASQRSPPNCIPPHGTTRTGFSRSERGSSPSEIIQAGAERMTGAGEEKDEEAWRITRGWGRAGRERGEPGGVTGRICAWACVPLRGRDVWPWGAVGICGHGHGTFDGTAGMEAVQSRPQRPGPGTTHMALDPIPPVALSSWAEGAAPCWPNGTLPALSSGGPGDTNPDASPNTRSSQDVSAPYHPSPVTRIQVPRAAPLHTTAPLPPWQPTRKPNHRPADAQKSCKDTESSELTGRGSAPEVETGVYAARVEGRSGAFVKARPKTGPV